MEAIPEPAPIEVASAGLSFRERLRQWEIDHAESFPVIPQVKEIASSDVLNNTTRPQVGEFQVEREQDDLEDDDMTTAGFRLGDLVDVGSKRSFLLPGDLVELLYVTCWLYASDRRS